MMLKVVGVLPPQRTKRGVFAILSGVVTIACRCKCLAVCQDPRMRPKGRPPAEHKFLAGQKVILAANLVNRSAAGGGYVVTRQLPERDGQFEYRIKKISELHERVARESELVRE
jgi:hypothetical protein